MSERRDFFTGGIWYSTPEAIGLVLVLGAVREHLESQDTWSSLVADVGDEEARLLDKLEP